MLKTHERGNSSRLIIFRLRVSASLLCYYACNWHTESYLYCAACCPTATNSSDWSNHFSRSDSGSHAYRQIFSFSLTHRQMLPPGKVMCIIRLVAPLAPQSKYKHDSQQVMALALTQDGGIPSVVLY